MLQTHHNISVINEQVYKFIITFQLQSSRGLHTADLEFLSLNPKNLDIASSFTVKIRTTRVRPVVFRNASVKAAYSKTNWIFRNREVWNLKLFLWETSFKRSDFHNV